MMPRRVVAPTRVRYHPLMTRARDRIVRHHPTIRTGLALACACAIVSSLLACDPLPSPTNPALAASARPATAIMATDTEVEARLYPPSGENWRLGEVEVKNAKAVARDGDSPLLVRLVRSEPNVGETTVEGADEPIEVTVTWVDKKDKSVKATAVFKLSTSPNAKRGESVTVSAAW